MTTEELILLFEQIGEERDIFEFDKIKDAPSKRRDLCALMLLDRLVPWSDGGNKIVSAAEHDQVWIDVDLAKLAKVITPEDVTYLCRCGVFVEEENESLSMFE